MKRNGRCVCNGLFSLIQNIQAVQTYLHRARHCSIGNVILLEPRDTMLANGVSNCRWLVSLVCALGGHSKFRYYALVYTSAPLLTNFFDFASMPFFNASSSLKFCSTAYFRTFSVIFIEQKCGPHMEHPPSQGFGGQRNAPNLWLGIDFCTLFHKFFPQIRELFVPSRLSMPVPQPRPVPDCRIERGLLLREKE